MSDVFISYASADRDSARALARLLEQGAYSVFWDRTIPPGKSWDEILEQALREARAVVVLWSRAAVASEWVKAEAADAAARGILVPAMIEKVDLPLRFRAIQAADLTGWNSTDASGEVGALLASIGALLGRRSADAYAASSARAGAAPAHMQPVPVSAPRPGAARTVLGALGVHLLLGIGLFRVDRRLRRRWLYVAAPAYAIVDVLLARMGVAPFRTSEFGASTFVVAVAIYGLSFIDVGLTQYRRWKRECDGRSEQ